MEIGGRGVAVQHKGSLTPAGHAPYPSLGDVDPFYRDEGWDP